MTEQVRALFSPPIRQKGMKRWMQVCVLALGIFGAVSLVTSYHSVHQLAHLVSTSVCVYGMIALNLSAAAKQTDYYQRGSQILRNLAIAAVWTAVGLYWLMEDVLT